MRSRRGPFVLAAIVASAVLGAACDSEPKRPKGPNPYRRDYQPAKAPTSAAAQTRRAADGLDRLAAGAPTSAPAGPFLPPGTIGSPVMFVNKETIGIEEVLMPIRDELEKAAAALPRRDYMNKAAQTIRREIDRQVMFAVVYLEAKKGLSEEEEKQYLKAADAEVQQIVNLRFGGLHARFERYLTERGMTVADLREKTKRRFVVLKYLSDRFRPLAEHPKREELRRYYEAHLADFTTKARARMSLIEVSFDADLKKPRATATAEDRAAAKASAKAKITRARQEIDSGVPFEAVARAYSDGVHAADGGAWEEIGQDSLRERYKPVCDALFAMQPGAISDVIEGSDAYFIVRCDALQPGRTLTFEEAQPQIAEKILDQRYTDMQDRYVQDLLKKAIIQKDAEFFQAVMAAIPQAGDANR